MATDAIPPPGSDERLGYERLGKALLTDNGRVIGTPQATTIAVEALAARMRSSTLELALAATGLVVGSDMVGRLGDSRYVLLPYDERYPSKGADVLHSDELGSTQYRPFAHRAIRMDTAEAERLVRMIATSELMGAWSHGSSHNARALALQEITAGEFGLSGVRRSQLDGDTRWKVERELRYNTDALTDFVRTQYAMTQELLQARGITELVSYRAQIWSAEERPPWGETNPGQVVEAPQRPLAGWSPDRQVIADWLKARRKPGVILAARHSARDVVSLPMTGMGLLSQKRWVTLPGDHQAVVDGVVSDQLIDERKRSAVVAGSAPAGSLSGATRAVGPDRQPHLVAARPRAPDELDARIGRILDDKEEVPPWWPRDDSGYSIARRDLEFLRIDPRHVRWMLTGKSPMGLTPRLYQQFAGELLNALDQDRIKASQVDIRLKGTAAGFFSGLRKTLPTEAELAGQPDALERMREWFGSDERRPLRRPYDAMYRLGLEPEPSDYDLDINSTAAVRVARAYWRDRHGDRYPGDFMGGHGYLDEQAVVGPSASRGQTAMAAVRPDHLRRAAGREHHSRQRVGRG
ncbi:hypothetical protein [Kribbella sp. CA-293567]|uniref:hypothetical protein n=1 Tax=Kribbella sp. CA-293567 TaxID=3002436 RepID=UPI0022DE4D8A|nr:hypothetical protein [Kribbella sp. CA-293567]WBQ07308.1 hypothetical protein OX958_10990 [Kribbella sp. CA-293567]